MRGYFCTNCGADLEDQSGFDSDESYWVCEECGHLNKISEEEYSSGGGASLYSKLFSELVQSHDEFNDIEDDEENRDSDFDESDSEYDDDIDINDEEEDQEQDDEDLLEDSYQAVPRERTIYIRKPFVIRHWKGLLRTIVIVILCMTVTYSVVEYRKLIPIGVDYHSLVGRPYDEARALLQEKGFLNVEVSEDNDLDYANRDKNGTIKKITVQRVWFFPFLNASRFSNTSRFPYDSPIYIIYHGMIKLPVPISSENAIKQNYKDIQMMFKNAGFMNVKTEKDDDLITGWIKKKGSVEKVSINGQTEFEKSDKFRLDAKIIITYHTF